MKFSPLHDRVVVMRINADQKSAGGSIIILDNHGAKSPPLAPVAAPVSKKKAA